MALGIQAGGGGGGGNDRLPYLKYDARAGKLFRVDRTNDGSGWVNDQTEITNTAKMVMDLENIETGWIDFPSGGAPDLRTVRIGDPIPEKPAGGKHRMGFKLHLKLDQASGGDVREISSNAACVISGMDALHDAYSRDAGNNEGKLPVVRVAKTTPITTEGKDATGKPVKSTNYRPDFEIVGWVKRPADLTVGAKPAQAEASPAAPPSTGSRTVAPPSAPAAAELEDEFG